MEALGADGDTEFLRLTHDMRKGNERIDPRARNRAYGIYRFACVSRDQDRLAAVLATGTMADHDATFRALFHGDEFDRARARERDACLAALLEAAGQRDDARQAWMTLRRDLTPADREWRERADAAITRLSAPR